MSPALCIKDYLKEKGFDNEIEFHKDTITFTGNLIFENERMDIIFNCDHFHVKGNFVFNDCKFQSNLPDKLSADGAITIVNCPSISEWSKVITADQVLFFRVGEHQSLAKTQIYSNDFLSSFHQSRNEGIEVFSYELINESGRVSAHVRNASGCTVWSANPFQLLSLQLQGVISDSNNTFEIEELLRKQHIIDGKVRIYTLKDAKVYWENKNHNAEVSSPNLKMANY